MNMFHSVPPVFLLKMERFGTCFQAIKLFATPTVTN